MQADSVIDGTPSSTSHFRNHTIRSPFDTLPFVLANHLMHRNTNKLLDIYQSYYLRYLPHHHHCSEDFHRRNHPLRQSRSRLRGWDIAVSSISTFSHTFPQNLCLRIARESICFHTICPRPPKFTNGHSTTHNFCIPFSLFRLSVMKLDATKERSAVAHLTLTTTMDNNGGYCKCCVCTKRTYV